MSLDVAQLSLGPFAENCYVVRAPGAPRPSSSTPAGLAATDRIEPPLGARRARRSWSRTGTSTTSRGVAELAEGSARPCTCAARRASRLERIERRTRPRRGRLRSAVRARRPASRATRRSSSPGIRFETLLGPRPHRGPPRLRRRRLPLLGRRSLRRLGRPHRPRRTATGTLLCLHPQPGRALSARDGRLPGPRRRRPPSGASSRRTRSSPSFDPRAGEVRGAARHTRRSARKDWPHWGRRRPRAADAPIVPRATATGRSSTPDVRGHRALRAHVRPGAPTSCRRRCTRSRTAATAAHASARRHCGNRRAYVQHGLHREPQPHEAFTVGPMFRYAAPQRGRYREYWQLDFEAIGSADPAVDAELIQLFADILAALGVDGTPARAQLDRRPELSARVRRAPRAFLDEHAASSTTTPARRRRRARSASST